MAATNVRSPSGPQDCTLYYYHWPCGHTIGVKCTRCNLSDSRNIEAHLTHQHKEVQLPHPKHHCPECGGLALHELRWASTSNPDAVQSQEATTAVFNRPDVIEAQLEQDVYEKESPWMNDDLFTEDPTANEMRGEIIMDLYRSQLHVEDLEQRLHQTFRDPPARASASSRPLTASATPFQPGVPWVASHQHQPQQPNVPQQNGSSMVLALRDRGRGHGQHIPARGAQQSRVPQQQPRGGPRGQARGQWGAQRGHHQQHQHQHQRQHQQPPRGRGAPPQRGIYPGQPGQRLPPLHEDELQRGRGNGRGGRGRGGRGGRRGRGRGRG